MYHQCLNMFIFNRCSGANEFRTINLLFKSIYQIIFYPSTNSTLVPNSILKTFKIKLFNRETTPATLKLSCSWDQINVSIRQRIGNLKKTYIGDHRMTISNHSSELRWMIFPMYERTLQTLEVWFIHRSSDVWTLMFEWLIYVTEWWKWMEPVACLCPFSPSCWIRYLLLIWYFKLLLWLPGYPK